MMANRLGLRPVRRAGPTPFSSAWMEDPDAPAPPQPLPVPAWIPNDRLISATLVLLLTLAIALAAGGQRETRLLALPSDQPSNIDVTQAPAMADVSNPTTPISIVLPPPPAHADTTSQDDSDPPPVAPPSVGGGNTIAFRAVTGEAIFPRYRVLTYYGHPHDSNMGILGEHTIEEVHQLLLAEAANYQAADPSRPVIPAFELIATVAQSEPGSDGTYILDTDLATLTEYADYAATHNMLLFLDLQIGHGSVRADFDKVSSLLKRPEVHLALDPEFAMSEGEIPGEHFGSLPADEITYAQERLAQIAAENDLPPKILIVHQFREDMILDKQLLASVEGVQLVIDADGYGPPVLKTDVYNILVRDYFAPDPTVAFAGIKLFYKQDDPLMTAAEVLLLTPAPDLIIYQ